MHEKFLNNLTSAMNNLSQLGFSTARAALQDTPGNWYFLWIAREQDPEPLSKESLQGLNPYGNTSGQLTAIEGLAEQGYLDVVGDGAYRLSKQGRESVDRAIDILNDAVASLDLLPEQDVQRLDVLLGKLVDEALGEPTVSDKSLLQRNHTSYPGEGVKPIVRVFHYLTDVNSYRDDAHLSTWRNHHDLDGPAWEALTFLWRDGINTTAALHERLVNRNYDEALYQRAFDKLVNLGWVKSNDDGTYQLTDAGKQVREDAEAATERGFFAPLDRLGNEADELTALLGKLSDVVQQEQRKRRVSATWDVALKAMTALSPHYMNKTRPYLREKFMLGPHWGVLFNALGYDVFTSDIWHSAQPFNNPEALAERLHNLAEAGWFEKSGDGYRKSTKGLEGLRGFFTTAHQALGEINLGIEELETLADYLKRVVSATAELEEPASKLNFQHSRLTDPGEDSPVLSRIDQYITDLERYRDDAHNGAWQTLDVSPRTFDVLSLVWNGTGNTAQAIYDARTYRGYDVDDYASSLDEAVELGWLTRDGDSFALTDDGKTIRDKIEALTDSLFYAGWSVLGNDELNQLNSLLQTLEKTARLAYYHKLYALVEAVSDAFPPLYQPSVEAIMQATGMQAGDWFKTLATQTGKLDANRMVELMPYANYQVIFDDWISGTAERGFVTRQNGGYVATDKGNQAHHDFFEKAYIAIGDIELLDEETMTQISDLLAKLVNAIEAEDLYKPFFDAHRITNNLAQVNATAAIDQYASDIMRWRHDAHIAAWKESNLQGHELDAWTLIWKDEANNAQSIQEKRSHRGFTVDDYQAAIDTLVARGLVTANDNSYQITEEGRQQRQAIEERTDEIFFAPWSVLSGSEQAQLALALEQLNTLLEALAPETTGV